MTKQDLIELLVEYPDDAKIFFYDDTDFQLKIEEISPINEDIIIFLEDA